MGKAPKARPSVLTRAQQLDALERENNPHLYGGAEEERASPKGKAKKAAGGGGNDAKRKKKKKKKGKKGKGSGDEEEEEEERRRREAEEEAARKAKEAAAKKKKKKKKKKEGGGDGPPPGGDESRHAVANNDGPGGGGGAPPAVPSVRGGPAARREETPEENPLLGESRSDDGDDEEGALPDEPAAAPPADQRGFLASVFRKRAKEDKRTYESTGFCRFLTPCEFITLIAVVFVGLGIVVALAPWSESEGELKNPINDKANLAAAVPASPRVVRASFYWQQPNAALAEIPNPSAIPVATFSKYGMLVQVRVFSGPEWDDSELYPTFSEYVQFATTGDPKRSPNCFNGRTGYLASVSRVEVNSTVVSVYLPPANGVRTTQPETVSMYFMTEGGLGLPIEWTFLPDPLELPKVEARVDKTSQIATGAYAVSGFSPAGVSAGIGALPKLSLVSAAFDCPSEDFFEVEWIEHPLGLVDFPLIELGDYPPLVMHVTAFVCAYIITAGLVFVLLLFCIARKMLKGGPWLQSFGAAGIPSYLVPLYMFLAPGVAVTTWSCILHHPDAAVKVLAVITFLLLVLAPMVYYIVQMTSRTFKDGLRFVEKRDNDPTKEFWLTRFFWGDHEWIEKPEYEDEVFLDRHAMFFQDYKTSSFWFLGLEAGVAVFMGIAQSVQPRSDAECRWRSWSLLVLNTVHFCGFIFLSPLLAQWEAIYAFVLAGVLEAMLILIVINQGTAEREEHWTADAAGNLGLAEVWLIKIKVAMDILLALAECLIARDDDPEDGWSSEDSEPESPLTWRERGRPSPLSPVRGPPTPTARGPWEPPDITIYCGGEVYRSSQTGQTPALLEQTLGGLSTPASSNRPAGPSFIQPPTTLRDRPALISPGMGDRNVVLAHPYTTLNRESTPYRADPRTPYTRASPVASPSVASQYAAFGALGTR